MLRHIHRQQPELARLAKQFSGHGEVFGFNLGDPWEDRVLGELRRSLGNLPLLIE